VTNLPAPEEAALLTDVLREHQQWSVFWDPKYHLWRAAEDDPDSDLYAESPDAATIMGYITAHSCGLSAVPPAIWGRPCTTA
jgi:hypothetical protein